jgi:hypothetical protein
MDMKIQKEMNKKEKRQGKIGLVLLVFIGVIIFTGAY